MRRRETPAIAALIDEALEPIMLPPDRVGSPSSWWGHVPFAHWLVYELEPRSIVELGTGHGVSFSAFCNAVKHAGLQTRCYAIDSRQSDDVFNNLSESVQQKYSAFATLVRTTFNSALELFADGSIDLLHIDGPQTYDAVTADYAAWRPKLSDRAVVLFHDTADFERDFGVWRFWKEISEQHPGFEFSHGCGLGVLAPGSEVPDFVSALTRMEPAAAATLRQRLAGLGERWISVDELAASARSTPVIAIQSERDALREELTAMTQHAERLTAHLEEVRTSTSWRVTGPYRVAGRLLKRRVLAPLRRSQPGPRHRRPADALPRSRPLRRGRPSARQALAAAIRGPGRQLA